MGLAIVLAGKKPKIASGSEMEPEEADIEAPESEEAPEVTDGMLAAAHKAKLALEKGGSAGTKKFAEALLEFMRQCEGM